LSWANRWNLTAEWCCDRAIRQLINWKFEKWNIEIQKWGYEGFSNREGIDTRIELSFLPAEGFPRWFPFKQKMNEYLIEIERSIRTSIANDPVLCILPKAHLLSDIGTIRSKARAYCNRLIRFYEAKGYKRIIEKPQEVKHTRWAVLIQVLGKSINRVAKSEGTDASNVSRRFHEVLRRISLEPRKDLVSGCPKGNSGYKALHRVTH
jgi:hypothetical protein